ncbi:MAG: ferredoxin-NADP reductase [Psychrobacter glaciei]|jgi:ferredoxin-NADP reductase
MNSNASYSSNSTIGNALSKSWAWLASSIVNKPSFSGYFEPLIQWIVPQWRADLLRSKIHTVRMESADMYTLVIKPGSRFSNFLAGQYVELTVVKDGAWMSRYFSISSSPEYFKQTGLIEISIRIQENGRITPWLIGALNKGSVVNLSQAQGEFILPRAGKPLLMIAGGSGITPIRSMLQQLATTKDTNLYPQRDVTLLFYARSANHFLFEKELAAIQANNSWLTVHFINSENDGFFDQLHLNKYCPSALKYQVYICGPSPMILSTRKQLSLAHFSDQQVNYEFFGPEPIDNVETGAANILFSKAHKQISVSEDNNKTLLELAEEQNTNPVSGCRIGVCHQCICQKKSGIVFNQKTKQYSDTGQQEIQLCISVPVGDVVLDL